MPSEILVHLVSSNALDFSSISMPRKGHYFIRTDFTYLIGMEYICQLYSVFYLLGFYKRDFLKCFHPVCAGARVVW